MFGLIGIIVAFVTLVDGSEHLCVQIMSVDCGTQYTPGNQAEIVCGSDNTTYNNYCLYTQARCMDPHIHIVAIGPCLETTSVTANPSTTYIPNITRDVLEVTWCENNIRINCPQDFEPMCGSDGKMYFNKFGETVHNLHPFTEQFSSQSGASLLQYLTFEQKKTKIAQLLQHATRLMLEASQRQHGGSGGHPETSQLLLIVSDGRGLFMEGMEVVKTAVRQAREAGVFIVFVIIDNPVNKDSILDIKVPVFKAGGQVPEIKSYMDSFPFPFYIILRDINNLPMVLSDALRQWFELVTAVDR